MKLLDALNQKCEIIELVEANDGEITDQLEMDLGQASLSLERSVESVVFYRKNLKQNIDYIKDVLRGAIRVNENKLKRLDNFLLQTLSRTGKLQTPIATLGITTRSSERVIIDDFDKVCDTFGSCVQITTDLEAGERKIKILKSCLKESKKEIGWHLEKNQSEFVNARIKGDRK